MDISRYRRYLHQFVDEAIKTSDGTTPGISEKLWVIKKPGRFSRHREEKTRAMADARYAFDEHRHWPLQIILSHLGVEIQEPQG